MEKPVGRHFLVPPWEAGELLTWDVLCCTLCRLDKCYGEKERTIHSTGKEISIKHLLSIF